MIRFACPGCGASYSVDDSKAGKTGKCPKCASQFQIPMSDAGGSEPEPFPSAPPPPMSTPGDVGDRSSPVEIEPCPGCQARLSVNRSDIGIDVECPYCKSVYKAEKAGSRPPVQPPAPLRMSDPDDDAGGYKPAKSRRTDEDDDDRPSRRRPRDDDDDDDRPSRRRSRDDDDDDDRPRRRRRSSGGGGSGGDGAATAGLILGLIGLVAWLCPILGFIIGGLAIKYGNQAKEESGGDKGSAGVVLGWICVMLALLNCCGGFVLRMNEN